MIYQSLILFLSLCSLQSVSAVIADVPDLYALSYDENDRLTTNYLVVANAEHCFNEVNDLELAHREVVSINSSVALKIFGDRHHPTKCSMACIEKGIHKTYIHLPLPIHTFTNIEDPATIGRTVSDKCQKVEIGFVTQIEQDSIIYWINSEGERHQTGYITPGERNTVLLTTYLGHQFEVVDSVTGELLRHCEVTTYQYCNVGVYPSAVDVNHKLPDFTPDIERTFQHEWVRAHRVKRTFTEFGFDKGRLPSDLYASMSAYYYNNQDNMILEEWEGKGVFVNWWERDVYFIPMSWVLKRYWQSRLKDLVEAWVGVPLELTDIYGMRRYEDGARLLTHVDREATHATSLIINIAQGHIRSPWKIEIYDFADRLHDVEMHEGDIVYYESARCLHGRMRPLDGGYYVNLFAHYRPIGDPEWFTKENPADNTPPKIDIGECTTGDAGVSCSRAESHEIPHLSKELERLHGPKDLFEFWKKVAPSSSQTSQPTHGEL